jgi:hypothetical protein
MSRPLLERQAELPSSISLYRYAPNRRVFTWEGFQPGNVTTADDLPEYLILGLLDLSRFQLSEDGWSARWQGVEDNSYFDVSYEARDRRWVVQQTWQGIDGGTSFYSSQVPLNKVIGQALYMRFPRDWDSFAKMRLEAEHQLTVIEQPEDAYTFCGIPDGAFRTILFPVAIRNLRPVQQWLMQAVESSHLTYPINVEAKLVFQAINYLEGKAPDWTTQDAVVFHHSVEETGMVPQGFPVREVANDGSAAWTVRREIYFLFVGLPFSGLVDFIERVSTENGPIRLASDPALRFELRPVVIPAGFDIQTESIALWDAARTTRSFLKFSPVGLEGADTCPEDIVERERNSETMLAQAEGISAGVVDEVRQVFERATGVRKT